MQVVADVAQDAHGNNNTVSNTASGSYDATAPTVVITDVPATANAAFTATFTFSEAVTGFAVGDITVTGGAASVFSGTGKTYTATITPSGDYSVQVVADVAQDAHGNNNTVSNTASGSYDATAPTVVITDVPATANAAFTATFTFSEAVTGFAVGDITVTGGAASVFSGTGKTYTATITPSGDYSVQVVADVAQDAHGNNNTVSNTASGSYDATAPTVVITDVPATANAAFTATFTFSEAVTGFAVGDITVTGGAASNFSGTGKTYTATITPSGDYSVQVVANVAQDAHGNNNTVSNTASGSYDATAPTVTVSGVPATANAVFTATFTFSEAVTDFVVSDITVTGGAASNFSGTGKTYTATITPNADYSVQVVANVAQDAHGNNNTVSNTASGSYDATAPTVTVSGVPATANAVFTATFTFSEAVTDFVVSDITVTGGAASNFSGTGKTYTATITPNADYSVQVVANVAQDAHGNNNTVSNTASGVYDATAPTVTVSGVPATANAAFTATFTFSEAVTDFVVSDITVTGGAASGFSGTGADYTATITPNADYSVQVAAAVAQDAHGNNNAVSNTASGSYDATAPTVIVSGVPATANAVFTATFTFSEAVTGFAVSDITVTGGAASGFSGTGADYTATITPNADYSVQVAANVAQDAHGNNNTVSNTASGVYGTTAPTVIVSGVPATANAVFTATFTFSEAVTGFVVSDITVTGGAASGFSGTGADYTATITPNADYSVQVAADVAQDATGNGNIVSNTARGVYGTTAPSVPPPPPNAAPEFSSAAEVSAAENQREVLTVQAVDADEQDGAVLYGLSGGADQSRFAIDPASGALTFTEWPDYENPSASGGDNEYVVIVQATSGTGDRELSAEQTITVTVTDVEEVVLEPGTPVKESGVYQRGRSTITVADRASAEVSVTLPDAIVDANGDALLQVTVTLADAPSTPLPERSAFGFDDKTRVDVEVSPVPVGGVELCLPVSATLRAKSGGQPLQVLHFSGGAWRALPSEAQAGEGQVCASGVSEFSPFMAGFAVTTAAAAATVVEAQATPAWLARFGRAVTDQVLDAVSGRLAAPKSAGVAVSLAGRAVPVWSRHSVAPEDGSSEDAAASAATPGDAVTERLRASLAGPAERGVADAMRSWLVNTGAGDDDAAGGIPGAQSLAVQSWSPTARDLRSGTSFALTGAPEADGALLSFWGQGALNRFDGREDDLALNGEAITLLVGADRSRQSHTVGAMLGYSQVVGGYGSSAPGKEAESGEIEATLTGVYPYTGMVMHERLSAWAVAGYGAGALTIKPEGGGSVGTGLSLTMAAAGVRGEAMRAPQAGGLSLAVKGDVRVTRVSSDAATDALAGRLLAANVGVWRVRAGIEGRRSFALDAKGSVVTPGFEIGARFDGGDAETDFGVDLGGGVALVNPGRGVTAALKARGLVAHKDHDLREWGVSAAFAWDPRPQTQRGWSLSLVQSWGASSSGGTEALFSRDTLAGLAANDESPVGRRLAVELGYGLAVFGGDFTGVPNVGVALTEGGRDWRLGWRLTPAWPDASGFEVNLDVVRNEVDGEAPEHAVTLRGGVRF